MAICVGINQIAFTDNCALPGSGPRTALFKETVYENVKISTYDGMPPCAEESDLFFNSLDGVTSGPFGRPTRYRHDGCPELDDILDDPAIVAWMDRADLRFPRCVIGPRVQRISDGWGKTGGREGGWAWDGENHVMIRECPSAETKGAAQSP